jgi:hypothetical protein
VRLPRSDRGAHKDIPEEELLFIEGLALQKPKRSNSAIHRLVREVSDQHGWLQLSYRRLCQIVQTVVRTPSPQEEAPHPDEAWQVDASLLSVKLGWEDRASEHSQLMILMDPSSRAIVGSIVCFGLPGLSNYFNSDGFLSGKRGDDPCERLS